jgi:hypothetical protein
MVIYIKRVRKNELNLSVNQEKRMKKNQAQSRIMGIYYSTKERLASMVAWIPRQRRMHSTICV